MPFGTISGPTGQQFEPRTPGVYALAGLTFADPINEIRVTGASPKRDGSRSGSVTRVVQKDVTLANGGASRKSSVVTLNMSVPNDGSFTAEEIDSFAADISTFLTPETVSRILQREA